MSKQLTMATALAAAAMVAQASFGQDAPARIAAAEFDEEGRLVYPANVEEWIHVGSNLGLNYNEAAFDPDSPGMFGVVTMEPNAYRAFMETGAFAEGTMLHLSFHRVVRDEELSPDGFATGPSMGTEIHYKDSAMFPDGFNFFTFPPGAERADAVPLPNDCVTCHTANADADGVFTQFYPAMRARLAEHETPSPP